MFVCFFVVVDFMVLGKRGFFYGLMLFIVLVIFFFMGYDDVR